MFDIVSTDVGATRLANKLKDFNINLTSEPSKYAIIGLFNGSASTHMAAVGASPDSSKIVEMSPFWASAKVFKFPETAFHTKNIDSATEVGSYNFSTAFK